MSQSQPEELEATIELVDPDGNVIDTIVLPADEMLMLEAAAKEAGVSTEQFVQEVIEQLIERAKAEDVDN